MLLSRQLLASLVLAVASPVAAIWPIPASISTGNTTLLIHQNIAITYNQAPVIYTYGYEPHDPTNSIQVVKAGVSRALSAIFRNGLVPWKLRPRNTIQDYEPNLSHKHTYVTKLIITQTSKDTTTTFKPAAGEVDESYNLTLSTAGVAKLTAVSSIGVLRGLETFVQLFYEHSSGTAFYTALAPVDIQDSALYAHRGVLLDVSRSYYDMESILRTIDAMSWNKMNRLHLHMTDSQAWPLELPTMPEVSAKGAYATNLVYTASDVDTIQRYGQARGVEVLLEIDMPGHIGAVALSHPDLIVAYDAQPYNWWCAEPPCGAFKLNETKVYKFLEDVFDDLLPRVKPYTSYFHLGGDELNANDSMLDSGVLSNDTAVLQPLLQKFIDTNHEIVRSHGLTPMCWEEIPIDWNVTLGDDVVVQLWLGSDSVKTVTSAGHKVIDSNYNYWYLDCGRGAWMPYGASTFSEGYPFTSWCDPFKSWMLVYSHDPRAGLTETEAELVLGGEVAVWSEVIDDVTLDGVLWPRASAASEVLWSGRTLADGTNRTLVEVSPRLNEMRERMINRGVQANIAHMLWCTQTNGCNT